MDFLCPNSPNVWDGNFFSPCFQNLFLGFGANMLGISVVVVLAVTTRGNPSITNLKLTVVEKAFLYVIPAVGACLSFYFIFSLLEGSYKGYQAEYHDWLYSFSRLLSWVIIVVISNFKSWYLILCNSFLCFWWIAKPLMEIPHLHTVIYTSKVMTYLMEILFIASEIMFGICIILIKATRTSNVERVAQQGQKSSGVLSSLAQMLMWFVCFWKCLIYLLRWLGKMRAF